MKNAPDENRPLGRPVPDWTPPSAPGDMTLTGEHCQVEPLDADRHAAAFYSVASGHDWLWDYLPYGPFHSAAAYHRWVNETVSASGHKFYALRDLSTGKVFGIVSYLRIAPNAGSIEIGNICIAPSGQRSRAFTEAMFLMMRWAFQAGYRRYEWKCNALNLPSRSAAQRLGFSYEGVFRQALIVKGRNRDTAWFACTDGDWPGLRQAFTLWLDAENFDTDGQQRERLSDLTRLVRVSSDPALVAER